MTDPGLTSKLDAELSKNGLTLSILVNNAGVGRGSHAIETTDEDLQRYFDINVKGAFALVPLGSATDDPGGQRSNREHGFGLRPDWRL